MSELPKVIVSSVIRSAVQGESHGGVYLVDLESGTSDQVIDWNDQSISWEGRGWDRGLRGIAFYNGKVYLAASDEIFVYDQSFNLLESYRNPYLKHCHEIAVHNNKLFLTSTGFDSILEFDLINNVFSNAIFVELNPKHGYRPIAYDPNSEQGPKPSVICHLNNVFWQSGEMFISGLKMSVVLKHAADAFIEFAKVPLGTHNARPYNGNVLMSDTSSDRVLMSTLLGELIEKFSIPYYPVSDLSWTHLTEDRARQAFARGLCVTGDELIISGASPSTIRVYKAGNSRPVKSVQLSCDIRNSVHGLEVWPYA